MKYLIFFRICDFLVFIEDIILWKPSIETFVQFAVPVEPPQNRIFKLSNFSNRFEAPETDEVFNLFSYL